MKVSIHYFALLQDMAGKSQEEIQTQATTAQDLYFELKKTYDFPIDITHLKVAINDEFADFSTTLNEGDKIVFIPPVAGG